MRAGEHLAQKPASFRLALPILFDEMSSVVLTQCKSIIYPCVCSTVPSYLKSGDRYLSARLYKVFAVVAEQHWFCLKLPG
jgi:hypothetical protein